MNRAKKPKKNRLDRETKTPKLYIRTTTYFTLAVVVRSLKMVFGFTPEQMDLFFESYFAHMEEVADHRSHVWQFCDDTKELTGVDIVEKFDEWGDDIWQ